MFLTSTKATAFCMWFGNTVAIHAFDWNEAIIDDLSEQFEFDSLKDFIFLGNRDLIIALLDKNNLSYKIFKDRLILECIEIHDVTGLNGGLKLASIEDLEEVSILSHMFHHEEYGANAYRTVENVQNTVENSIIDGSVYKLMEGNTICSIIQVLSEKPYPVLGQYITQPHFRNRGLGSSLLIQLTNQLIAEGHKKVGLIADLSNAASLRSFYKAGYREVYKQIQLEIT